MKKNLNKIPDIINKKIGEISGQQIVAGCAVKFKAEYIASGKLAHLGITLTDKGLNVPSSVIPLKSQGKYSERNIDGLEIVRRDLPLETHYNTVETPNWGDFYNGTHPVDLPYKKYPREFFSPRELEIIMSPCSNTKPGLPMYLIAFRVEEVVDKKDANFSRLLLEDLNLLQENLGTCGVEDASTLIDEYAKSIHVSWEILPPGTLDEAIERIFQGGTPTQQQKDVAEDRYNFFQTLKAKNLIYGRSGLKRYFGASLADNLVIFENIEYGNAVYILFEDWESLSQLSRLQLRSGAFGKSFELVIHTGDWKKKVKDIVARKLSVK